MITNVNLVVTSLISLFPSHNQKKVLNVLIVKNKILKNYFVLLISPMEKIGTNHKAPIMSLQDFPEQSNSVVTEKYL